MKNYYEILEVSQNASSEVIEKAYKTLAKKYHPDANLNNIKEAEDKFKEISEAYEILSDEVKKAEYDYQLEAYLNNINTSTQYTINNEDYENLASHARQLEYELEALKRNDSVSNEPNTNTNSNHESINEITESLSDTINKAYSKAYHDAYIKRLKDYGYKIKYKKPFKTIVKNFFSSILAIIVLLIILFILWQIPCIKNYFVDFYNENYFMQVIIHMFK